MTEATPKRRRARKSNGTFKGDNPNTPNINEAWEPTELSAALPKEDNKYAVKQKVTGASGDAGKYQKKDKIRPTFGKVTTTFN